MRPTERLALYAGVALALILALGARNAGSSALALQGAAPATARIATVDAYIITERLMAADDLKKARENLSNDWNAKLRGIEKEFGEIEQSLNLLAQNDPKYQEQVKKGQQKNIDYQNMIASRDQEVEKLNSNQLITNYQRVVDAVKTIADKGGYTHVFTTRPPSRGITTTTVGATLQEMLARPMMIGPAADDLTKQVLDALKLDSTNLDAPPPAKPDDAKKNN